MNQLSGPLGLKARLRNTDLSLDIVPFLDILLLAFFMSLMGSHFVFSPGLPLSLPHSTPPTLQSSMASSVLTVSESNMLFFEGHIYNLDSIEQAFRKHLRQTSHPEPTLLLKMNRHSDVQALFNICEIARQAGFHSVQIAATQENVTSPRI